MAPSPPRCMVLGAWLLTLLLSSPQAVIFRVLQHPLKHDFYQVLQTNYVSSDFLLFAVSISSPSHAEFPVLPLPLPMLLPLPCTCPFPSLAPASTPDHSLLLSLPLPCSYPCSCPCICSCPYSCSCYHTSPSAPQ